MAVKVSGIKQVARNMNSFVKGVDQFVSKKTLTEVVITASNYAAILTPVDTANLINSQYMFVNDTATGWRAGVGYAANYAGIVHDGGPKNWQKAAAQDEFLRKGFEDNIPELRQIIINGYRV